VPIHTLYISDSQPVVRGPLVVRSILPCGRHATPNIYLILRNKHANRKFLAIFHFSTLIIIKQPDDSMKQICWCTIISHKFIGYSIKRLIRSATVHQRNNFQCWSTNQYKICQVVHESQKVENRCIISIYNLYNVYIYIKLFAYICIYINIQNYITTYHRGCKQRINNLVLYYSLSY